MSELRIVPATATPDEVAAIVAALAAVQQSRRVVRVAADEPFTDARWVYASRLTARRAGHQRGEWRLSGRISRRARA